MIGKYFEHGNYYDGELDATNLDERINKIGIPISWYANQLGISKNTLYNGLSGKTTMKDETIFNLGWLVCGIEGTLISNSYL